jgi:hypothetical protein
VDRGQNRRLHQPCIRQCHKVIVAVDEVKLLGVFKDLGDVEVFGYFGIDRPVLFITPGDDRMQVSAGERIAGGEESHIPAQVNQAFRYVAGNCFPGAILAWGRSPGNG